MAQYPNSFGPPGAYPLGYDQRIDSGVLIRFFNAVYAWMAAGLAVTAAVAWWVSTQPQILMHLTGGTIAVLFIVELVLVFTISAAVQRVGPAAATGLFLLYAAINGVTLSFIFLVYAHSMIASAFIVTAGMFGAMSLYGMATKRDLTGVGQFMIMGLIGIIIASIVSIFWHPTMLVVLINYLGAFIFLGLTAYDTQRLKMFAVQTQNNATLAARLSINGALMLYLDFLNLFLFLLQIFSGNSRNR
jgi:FtsH-binding integral membrane protein